MNLNLRDNARWLTFGALWIVHTALALLFGEWVYALIGIISLGTVIIFARTDAQHRARIRWLKITIASLERSLKEAHRHDR